MQRTSPSILTACFRLVLPLLAASCRLSAIAQPGTPLWTNYYRPNPAGFAEAHALAVDADRNVYVTGVSAILGGSWEFATVAYGTTGVSLWTNWYSQVGDTSFYSTALVTDRGHIYATGYSGGSNVDTFDYFVMAFSTAGESLWTNRYDGPAHSTDWPWDSVVDTNNGNLYVTGSSISTYTGDDFLTVAYSSNGTVLWRNRFGNNGSEEAAALVVAADGTVFVTGRADESCATIAYSPAGALLWTNFFNAGEFSSAARLTLDAGGNVYVAAATYKTNHAYDFAIIAYSHNGSPRWTNYYNGPANGDDMPAWIGADGSGHVYVTGSSADSLGGSRYVTLAYSTNGTRLWTKIYAGPSPGLNEPHAMAVDQSGNLYVTGTSSGLNKLDIVTIAYSASGTPLWTNRFNSSQFDNADAARIAVDNHGDVLMTGRAPLDVAGNTGFVTIKYAGQQQPLPIPLGIHQIGSAIQLTWSDPRFHLQSSPSVSRAFTNVLGATSPYSCPISGSQQFFRLHHE